MTSVPGHLHGWMSPKRFALGPTISVTPRRRLAIPLYAFRFFAYSSTWPHRSWTRPSGVGETCTRSRNPDSMRSSPRPMGSIAHALHSRTVLGKFASSGRVNCASTSVSANAWYVRRSSALRNRPERNPFP